MNNQLLLSILDDAITVSIERMHQHEIDAMVNHDTQAAKEYADEILAIEEAEQIIKNLIENRNEPNNY